MALLSKSPHCTQTHSQPHLFKDSVVIRRQLLPRSGPAPKRHLLRTLPPLYSPQPSAKRAAGCLIGGKPPPFDLDLPSVPRPPRTSIYTRHPFSYELHTSHRKTMPLIRPTHVSALRATRNSTLRAHALAGRSFATTPARLGGAAHYDPPSGWLFGVPPGQKAKKEAWEPYIYWGFCGSILLTVVAYAFKPDTRLVSFWWSILTVGVGVFRANGGFFDVTVYKHGLLKRPGGD